jgi:hypothetical protein
MQTETLTLKIKRNPKQQKNFDSIVSSIHCSAIEGGSYGIGYWCDVVSYKWDEKDDTKFKSVIQMGAEYEDDKDKRIAKCRKYTIDRDVIMLGIKRLAMGEIKVNESYIEKCAALLVTGEADMDADDADIIVQAGLFNEVIFG